MKYNYGGSGNKEDRILLTNKMPQIDGGELKEYETHLRGIHQMINVRGGIQNLGMKGQLSRWLMYYCHGPWSEGWEEGHFRYLCPSQGHRKSMT